MVSLLNFYSMLRKHDLKINSTHFQDVLIGLQRVQVRLNDRDYKESDYLVLREYNATEGNYTGQWVECYVNALYSDIPGLLPNYVMMIVTPYKADKFNQNNLPIRINKLNGLSK